MTEETEAAGLTRLTIPRPLEAERGSSASLDITQAFGTNSSPTIFGSRVTDPLQVERELSYVPLNQAADATNAGLELLGTWRRGPYVATANYTYVRSREGASEQREDAELTPRHSAGLVGMWEPEGKGRVGLEVYYTGRQRLEVNPYRADRKTLRVNYPLADKELPGGESNPATQQIDSYIRSPQQNPKNRPALQAFMHFFGMEITWK